MTRNHITKALFAATALMLTYPSYAATDKPGKLAKKQVEVLVSKHKSNPEEALRAMELATDFVWKADKYELTDDEKARICYLAANEYKSVNGEENSKWLGYVDYFGYHAKTEIRDFETALASADTQLRLSWLHPEMKGIRLMTAVTILDNLKKSSVSPMQSKGANALGIEISSEAAERLCRQCYAEMGAMTPDEWFASAYKAVYAPEKPLDKSKSTEYDNDWLAYTCVQLAKEAGAPDAFAIQADLHSTGRLSKYYPRNEAAAKDNFRIAAEKGGIWGAMKTAIFLMEEEKWQEAYQLALRHQDNPEFNWHGGDYVLGRLYESGAIEGKTWRDAQPLYDKCTKIRFLSSQKDARERSDNLRAMAMAEDIDKAVAEAGGMAKMTPKELAGIARKYQRLNRTDKAMEFWKAAADKGHAQACNAYAMLWCKNNDYMHDEAMKQIVPYFSKAAELEFYPALANLAVILFYGYGTDPDHDRALSLVATMVKNQESENLDDFDSDTDFLKTISGTKYSRMGMLQGDHVKKAANEHRDPVYLTMFGKARYKDSRPEVWQYYLKRAADMGHEPAKAFLHEAGVSGF